MTLNASGPISLGGATTGQSINIELGVSATALASINSAAFRNLAGVASGAISLSNFYGKSNITYYLITVTPSGSGTWYDNQQFDIDSSGNIYGALQGQSGSNNTLLKVGPTGVSYAAYTSTYSTASSNTRQGETMATAPSGATMTAGNIFASTFIPDNYPTYTRVVGVSFVNSAGTQSVYGAGFKYNASAGPTQVYSNAGCNYRTSSADSSGNFYVTFSGAKYYYYGSCPCSGAPIYDLYNTGLGMLKFSSAFGLTFSTILGDGSGYSYPQASNAIAAANGTVFVIGVMGNPNGNVRSITNTNGSGTIQWAKYYSITTANFTNSTSEMYGTADSSSNAFMIGITTNTSLSRDGVFVMKTNSAGVHQWTRAVIMSTGGVNFATRGGCCDSAGSVYFVGTTNTNPFATICVKYNSSGVFQWAMSIVTNSGAAQANGRVPRILPNGAVAISIPTYPNWTPYIFIQLPADGSKTGTFTISGLTITVSAAAITSYDLSSSEATRTNAIAYGSSISTVSFSQSSTGSGTATLAVTTI